jgi:hypothetical protein
LLWVDGQAHAFRLWILPSSYYFHQVVDLMSRVWRFVAK